MVDQHYADTKPQSKFDFTGHDASKICLNNTAHLMLRDTPDNLSR